MNQLTFFPEKIEYLKDSEKLQIQNRFGVFRTDGNLTGFSPVNQFPSFIRGKQVQTGKISPVEASPDGRYLIYMAPTSFGYGRLMLYNVDTALQVAVAEEVEVNISQVHAKWSPNSKLFVYAKNNQLYYYSIEQLEGNRVLAESFRGIGPGRMPNVDWNSRNNLYYISKSLIYEVVSTELFTRTIYSGLLEVGNIIGKLPFAFDPNFDTFYMSPSASAVLLNKGGRNIFVFPVSVEDYISTGKIEPLPYLFLPRNTRVLQVIWSRDDVITLLAGSISSGEDTTSVFRLDSWKTGGNIIFIQTQDLGVKSLRLSPDERRVALLTDTEVRIKRYQKWEDEAVVKTEMPLHVVWRSETELIIAGSFVTSLYSLANKTERIIALSQADEYGFSDAGKTAEIRIGSRMFQLVSGNGWKQIDRLAIDRAKSDSKNFRVYLENLPGSSYRNIVMVRNITGYGTRPLFNYPEMSYEPFPQKDEPVDLANFSHGSRIRQRQVSLVFNAIDNVEGLTEILSILSEYRIRATFFVNGEFIRRHPGAVKEIALSGHEIGSLFYTYFDMTDARFKVDGGFIKQGLARNEDDYFATTGREVSLLWHAPYYFTNSEIIQAAKDINYTYVGRDIDTLDWVTREQSFSAGSFYYPAAKLVERVIQQKKPGSIIPIRIGKAESDRDDYLFHKLDILINGLISLGYSIVPVTTLMENSR
ncbi:MAG: polysaccharide deacetylase family protein [Spirochaetales bacterium]|nr:MAG: polysaccharide deacetylase family protein [Spirochaetales bacterium]